MNTDERTVDTFPTWRGKQGLIESPKGGVHRSEQGAMFKPLGFKHNAPFCFSNLNAKPSTPPLRVFDNALFKTVHPPLRVFVKVPFTSPSRKVVHRSLIGAPKKGWPY